VVNVVKNKIKVQNCKMARLNKKGSKEADKTKGKINNNWQMTKRG
jgi:hypothetical protein